VHLPPERDRFVRRDAGGRSADKQFGSRTGGLQNPQACGKDQNAGFAATDVSEHSIFL
jgi:hypothetical protein